jgi:inorganic triphosphatase YgiF
MPGFTSFLIGHGPFAADQDVTPPQSDDEFETEALKKHRLQQERRRARQTSHIYGTLMTRKDAECTLALLKQLKSDIDAQIERFHDTGVASEKKRKEHISEFTKLGQSILKSGTKVIDRFGNVQGALQTFSEVFTELNRAMVAGGRENGKVDILDAKGIVTVYQQAKKPLGDMVKDIGKALGKKEAWSDPK